VSYDTFLAQFKQDCTQVLSFERPDGVWDLHSLRKMGYLYGLWADAPFHELKARDIFTLKSIAEENGTFLNLNWKCPFVQDRHAAVSLNRNIARLDESLGSWPSLAKRFVEYYCRVTKPSYIDDPTSAALGTSMTTSEALSFRTAG